MLIALLSMGSVFITLRLLAFGIFAAVALIFVPLTWGTGGFHKCGIYQSTLAKYDVPLFKVLQNSFKYLVQQLRLDQPLLKRQWVVKSGSSSSKLIPRKR